MYSPLSISDAAKLRSGSPSIFVLLESAVWSTTPSPSASVQRLPSWLTSVQL